MSVPQNPDFCWHDFQEGCCSECGTREDGSVKHTSIIPNERQVQRSILAMIGISFPTAIVHHSPNGGHLAGDKTARFKQVGALKGDGMKIGWPDLMVVWNHGIAFMEVKRPKYTPSCISEQQARVHKQLAECGYPVAIVTSPEEAMAFLDERGAPWKRGKV